MVVGDDQFQAEAAGHQRLGNAGNATVDCDHQLHSLPGERFQRLGVEPIALLKPVGNIPLRIGIECFQAADENGGGAHAVGVVVAVDGDLPASPHRIHNPFGGRGHAREKFRVAEIGECARQKAFGGSGIAEAPRGQKAGHDRRDSDRMLKRRHNGCIVRLNPPAFRHGSTPFKSCPAGVYGKPLAALPRDAVRWFHRGAGRV